MCGAQTWSTDAPETGKVYSKADAEVLCAIAVAAADLGIHHTGTASKHHTNAVVGFVAAYLNKALPGQITAEIAEGMLRAAHTGTAGSTTPATPELSIDQDGEIAFDWASETNGVRDLLSISLGEDGRLSFAFMIGERKGSGTIYAKLPPVLFEAIKHFAAEPEESSATSGQTLRPQARG